MKLASLIMAGAVALAGTAALAQNEAPNSSGTAGGRVGDSAHQMGQDAKDAGHKVTDAVKRGWDKLRGKAHDAKDTAKADTDKKADRHASRKDDTRAMGAARSDDKAVNDTSRQQRMDDAYGNYKNKSGDTKK
jgi:hypothetical protein